MLAVPEDMIPDRARWPHEALQRDLDDNSMGTRELVTRHGVRIVGRNVSDHFTRYDARMNETACRTFSMPGARQQRRQT